MAKFYEDFRTQEVGGTPAAFDAPFGNLNFVVEAGNPLPDSQSHLKITPGASVGGFDMAALSVPGITVSGKTTIRSRVSIILNDNNDQWFVGSIMDGAGTSHASRTGIIQMINSNDWRLITVYSGSNSYVDKKTESNFTDNRLELYVETIKDGNDLEIRAWEAGGSRPAVANHSGTATDSPAPGFLGMVFVMRDPGAPPVELYSLEVATDGDAISGTVVGNPPSVAPVLGTPDPGVSSVTVDFTFSESSNTGDAPTNFDVRLDSGEWKGAGSGASRQITLDSLTPATEYNTPGLEMRAVNNAGKGPVSTPATFTTEPLPPVTSTPVPKPVTNVTPTSVTLNWVRGT
ncbi:MAG: fibronectin type III domain-containing protein [Marinobacter sp.]